VSNFPYVDTNKHRYMRKVSAIPGTYIWSVCPHDSFPKLLNGVGL